ncbi:MAG: hypothetical protein JRE92_03170 [Deltaproteobacteria bacterium]|jgi:hypothetical protein|nr:hypothetical protein [Deltaproteobacteria bacterium]
MKYKLKKILEKALNAFQKATGLNVDIHDYEYDEAGYPDAFMRIAYEDVELDFALDVKFGITRATIGVIAQEFFRFQEKPVLVTRYVNPRIAELLKDMDIPFIDTAGNAYINQPPLFVYIKGNKLDEEMRPEQIQRAFRPAGLKVIYVLLCNPGIEDQPLREIAKAAEVALGTVNRVMKELEKMGNLIEIGRRKRRLVKKDHILKRWVTAYPEQLRPKLFRGRFRAVNYDWWKDINIKDFGAYWGGEVAAALLTKYLRPEVFTIYTKQPIGKLVLKNKLKKDPDGNVEILNLFWNFKLNTVNIDLVNPVLVYADLMATGDTRNIETAGMIYDTEVTRFIRED